MPLPAPRPNDVPRLLLAAAPSYRGLAERVAGGLADGDPAHHIAVFAEHIADLAARDASDEFDAIFATVDSVLHQADAVTLRDIGSGLVVMLQIAAARRGVPLERFELWLGPLTREQWAAASAFRAAVRAAAE